MKYLSLLAMAFASLCYAQAPLIGTCSVFPPDNIWNTPIDHLPVASNSSTLINTIGAATGLKADFGSGTWNGGPIGIPFVKVPGTQTKYPATFLYWDESDPGPYAVPLNAPIEGGSASTGDRHAIAVDTTNCILYELYRAFPQSSSWQADSGAIFDLKSHTLRPLTWTSADAAGLPIVPGLMRYDEIVAGEIRHAIRFTVPQSRRAYVWPARHYASSLTGTQYPPMGQRFRLRAGFDVSTFPPEVQIILRAMKKYGIILADNGSPWYISGEPDSRWNNDNLRRLSQVTGSNFEAVDVSPLMIDVNSGQARQQSGVTVTPSTATVLVQQTVQFSASTASTWTVNGVAGGNSQVGYIDANGLYSAPSAVPTPATVSVRATSISDTSQSGTAQVTIQNPAITVSVSPASVSLRVNRTRQFTATVLNTTDKRVTWSVSGVAGGNSTVGTVSSSGLYRAPASVPSPNTVTVRATSAADSSKSGSATARIRP